MSNIERLETAGILKAEHFTEKNAEHRTKIQELSEAEVNALIALHAKMGEAPEGEEHLRPNIVV